MNEEQILFHPLNSPQTSKGPIIEHFQKHYKKHLFGLGILFGIALFKTITVLGSQLNIITKMTETINADYRPSATETAIATFDQIDVLANQKDKFFHQEGKIYSYTGETLFLKLDSMFHILDNTYHSATGTDEKFKIAEQLDIILNQQTELFQATQDINPDRDMRLKELTETFHKQTEQIQK